MTKRIFFAVVALLGLAISPLPVLADHDHDKWFKKYDKDHDNRWNYDEYCGWQRAHGKHLSDKQLRELYDRHDEDHDGYWQWEEAQRYHH